MHRDLKELLSIAAAQQAIHIPGIISQITNWPTFLLNYVGMKDSPATYVFRNGLKIRAGDRIDSATIAVVFGRREYGCIPAKATVIDIGANIGVFSLFAAYGTDGTTVYAYEPMPSTFGMLTENVKRNGLDCQVFAVQCAVAGRRGRRKLFNQGGSPFSTFYPRDNTASFTEIDCVSLGDIFREHNITWCDVLKLDCEGSEFEILYGADAECFGRIGQIRMEYHNQDDDSHNVDTLLPYLKERGFALRRFKRNSPGSGVVWVERAARGGAEA